MKLTFGIAAVFLSFVATGGAQAQVNQERNIAGALAAELAQGAVAACAAKNLAVTATVVDRAGSVRATIRADRAGPHTLDVARGKAYTSASTRAPTSVLAENQAKNEGLRNIVHIPGFIILGGGVPIKAGEDTIGAIGVSGAPSGQLDEECANAALQAVASKLR